MGTRVAPQRIKLPFDGHVIGEGYNSETAERIGKPLNADVGENPVASGQEATFKFQMITSQSSLEQSLNVGAELDVRYGLFSGGAKFDFAQKSAVNSNSTYILATAIVANAVRNGSNFKPTPEAEALIKAADKDGFKRAFGDRYTQALHTGGEFYAMVRVTSSSVEHQKNISASLHAELNGLAGGDFKASMNTARNDKKSCTEVIIQVHQTGGVGEQVQIPGTEANAIRDHMNRFARAAHDHGVAYQAELLTYDTLALPFGSPLEVEERQTVLADCLAQRQRYWSAIGDLTLARSENAGAIFEGLPSAEDLAACETAVRDALSKLMDHARKVSRGEIPPTVFVPPPLVLPQFKRRTAVSFSGWWKQANSNGNLLRDEKLLACAIGESLKSKLSVDEVGKAAPEALDRAASTAEDLTIHTALPEDETGISSLADLPKMLDAPLRALRVIETEIRNLSGIEEFSRLETLQVNGSRVSDVGAVASIAGLQTLDLDKNELADLAPLTALTNLRRLHLDNNKITDLAPLQGLRCLERLTIRHNAIASVEPLRGLPELKVLILNDRGQGDQHNALTDTTALAELPRLANPLTSTDRLRMGLLTKGEEKYTNRVGVATRIDRSNRFALTVEQTENYEHGQTWTTDTPGTENLEIEALFEWADPALFGQPAVLIALRTGTGKIAIACTKPDDHSALIPSRDLRNNVIPKASPADQFVRWYVPQAEFFVDAQPA